MFNKLFNKDKKESNSDHEKLIEIIRTLLPEDLVGVDIGPETRFDAIGFDSIKYINLILSLEDIVHKGLEEIVSEIDLASVQTVGDVFKLVEGFNKK